MITGNDYINSGILELYVVGQTNEAETKEVEQMALANPAIRQEIEEISRALELLAKTDALEPNPIIKPFLLATVDYTERLKNGEEVLNPPLLQNKSKVSDYDTWLNRADMVSPGTEDVFAKIISYTPELITAIVWIKEYAPQEVHDNEYEKFLVVEGTCEIIVGEEAHPLTAGDYFAIPLHKKHLVKVTSAIPCKVILQRVAA